MWTNQYSLSNFNDTFDVSLVIATFAGCNSSFHISGVNNSTFTWELDSSLEYKFCYLSNMTSKKISLENLDCVFAGYVVGTAFNIGYAFSFGVNSSKAEKAPGKSMADLASSETSLSTLAPNFMSSDFTAVTTAIYLSSVSSTQSSLQPNFMSSELTTAVTTAFYLSSVSSTHVLLQPSSTLYLPSVTMIMTQTHTYPATMTSSADPDSTNSQSPASFTTPPEPSCSTTPATQRVGQALTRQCPCVCKAKLDNPNQHSALVSWRKRLEEELLVDKSELYSTWLKKNSVENVTKSAKYMGSTLCCIFLCLIFGVILALDLTKVILYLCTLSKSRRKDSKS